MTNLVYQRLFQLNVSHSYFQEDICRCLEFNADAATAQLMKRFRFLIRRQADGFGLYSNFNQTAGQLLQYIEEATGQHSFSFEIRTTNPDFNLFTELPANWVGQIIFNSMDNTVITNKVLLSQRLSPNAGTLCLGMVTLRFEDILQYCGHTVSAYTQFEIRFEARATQWQYFVINRSQVPLSNPAICGKKPGLSAKDQISFDGPVHVITAAGQAALLFSSGNQMIPLTEAPIYKFDLIDRTGTAGNATTIGSAEDKKAAKPTIILKGLPNPDPQWIGRATGEAEALSSPMYIYL